MSSRKVRESEQSDLKMLKDLVHSCSLAVMVDLNAINRDVLIPRNENVDIVRIAFSKADVSRAKMLARELLECGYEVCLNFMSSHLYAPNELAAHAAEVGASIPYVVDSLGCMSAKEVARYFELLPATAGLHLHNNLQQAVGTYSAVSCGIVDATVFEMGRGAGNLPLELCDIPFDARAKLVDFYHAHMSNSSLLGICT